MSDLFSPGQLFRFNYAGFWAVELPQGTPGVVLVRVVGRHSSLQSYLALIDGRQLILTAPEILPVTDVPHA